MHGHDPHLVAAALIEIALHLDVARGEPVEKALERGSVPALIGKRRRHQLVERIGSVGAKPREHALAPAARTQHLGQKLVRRHEIGAAEQPCQEFRSSGEVGMVARAPAQLLPQHRLAPVMRQREKPLLVEAARAAP